MVRPREDLRRAQGPATHKTSPIDAAAAEHAAAAAEAAERAEADADDAGGDEEAANADADADGDGDDDEPPPSPATREKSVVGPLGLSPVASPNPRGGAAGFRFRSHSQSGRTRSRSRTPSEAFVDAATDVSMSLASTLLTVPTISGAGGHIDQVTVTGRDRLLTPVDLVMGMGSHMASPRSPAHSAATPSSEAGAATADVRSRMFDDSAVPAPPSSVDAPPPPKSRCCGACCEAIAPLVGTPIYVCVVVGLSALFFVVTGIQVLLPLLLLLPASCLSSHHVRCHQ